MVFSLRFLLLSEIIQDLVSSIELILCSLFLSAGSMSALRPQKSSANVRSMNKGVNE